MDLTLLFLVVVLLLAVQMHQYAVALGIFILMLFSSKNKAILIASVLGGGVALVYFMGESWSPLILIGLFIVLAVIAKSSPAEPGPEAYGYPPMM